MVASDPAMVVHARELTKTYRDFWGRPKVRAVRALNLQIAPGEVFGLLGPNGSGKSTTIKLMLGLLRPTSGRIRVFGHPPQTVPIKSRLGYLPEDTYLYPHLTSEETLLFFGRLFNLSPAVLRPRVEQLLEMTGLGHARRRPVGEFSKGMARRIGLAQALINDPDLVVLDEPTSGLDPIGCRQVKELIRTLARRGKTVVMSSHLLADVEDVCDRIAIMFNGAVIVEGRVRELLEEKEKIRMSFEAPEPGRLERVVELIQQATGQTPVMDHPARRLEQFFIDSLAQARTRPVTGDATGAGQTERVAAFLEGNPPVRLDILDRLARPEQKPAESPKEHNRPSDN